MGLLSAEKGRQAGVSQASSDVRSGTLPIESTQVDENAALTRRVVRVVHVEDRTNTNTGSWSAHNNRATAKQSRS